MPIPSLTNNGNAVVVVVPMVSPESASPVTIVWPVPLGARVRLLLLPAVEIVLAVKERLFAPKDNVPTLVILLLFVFSVPPNVNALICKFPTAEMMFVPLEKDMPALLPARVSPVVPFTVKFPPKVVKPVPVVIAPLLVVFKFNPVGLLIKILPVEAVPICSV